MLRSVFTMLRVEDNRNLQETLSDRRKRYGSYSDICSTTQMFKYHAQGIMQSRWGKDEVSYPAYMREGLDMIFHKLARILHGDPKYLDNWVDLIGYSKLVLEELEKETKN